MEGTSGPGDDAPPPDKGQPPPPPSPLSGAYLLIIVGEPHSEAHKEDILRKIANGFKSWDVESCHVSLDKEIQNIITQAPEGEEARHGERLIQFASENLVTEVLIQPQLNTLIQCVRNLLSSFTKHRHLVHAGYTFASNGSWIVQDGTFSLADLIDAFQENDVLRVLRAYENSVSVDIHCAPEGDWSTARFRKEAFSKLCRVRVNPDDCPTPAANIEDFIGYISPFLKPTSLEQLLEPSDVVGNIRFSHPTLYVFPGGQGDAALFGINGFNMLVDGGFARKACFWDFTRHLDRLDAVLMTRVNNSNVNGLAAVLRRKKINHVYPQVGHFFCNVQERRQALTPDTDKVRDPLLINLLDEGQEILQNLQHLQLKPHCCYRENTTEPINLYHKVGHGKLDMYVLSPYKDSKELREFLAKWSSHDSSLFSSSSKKFGDKEFNFPIQNLVSICALLVWQPANPNDTITRILFPGSTPQHKIFEGLEKLKHLEFMKHPVCSAKTLSPSSSNIGISTKFSKQKTTPAVIDKLLPGEQIQKVQKAIPSVESVNKQNIAKSATIPVTGSIIDTKVKHASRAKLKIEKTKTEKTEVDKTIESEKVEKRSPPPDIKKTDKIKEKPKKTENKIPPKVDKKVKTTPSEKKSDSVKSSPTTPKKIIENKIEKMNGVASKSEMKASVTRSSNKVKASPSSTPAKSAKEENNRKVVESKHKVSTPNRPPTGKTTKKEETKPKVEKKIAKKTTASPTKAVTKQSSPVKTVMKTTAKKKDVKKIKGEVEKGVITDSSAVSTPSTVDAEMTVMKETKAEEILSEAKEETKKSIESEKEEQIEEDLSKDIDEGVELKDKAEESITEDLAEEEKIIKDIKEEEQLDSLIGEKESEKEEDDEILIIEKVEVEQYAEDSIQDQESIESHVPDEVEDEIQKHMRDEAESEKKEKLLEERKDDNEIETDEKIKLEEIEHGEEVKETEIKSTTKPAADLKLKLVSTLTTDRLTPENKEQIFEEVQEIILSATEIAKSKIETAKDSSDFSAEGFGSDEQRTSGDTKDLLSSGDKMNVVSDKNLIESTEDENKLDDTRDKSKDLGDIRYGAEESQPDEKFSTTVESGATTAPTLPEDERIPLDEIKEGVEEKYVKEDTKEKDLGVTTKLEQPMSLPQVAVIGTASFETRGTHVQLRDIVKTPDEVADLPVHEEVDGLYEDDEFGRDIQRSKEDLLAVTPHKDYDKQMQDKDLIGKAEKIEQKEEVEEKKVLEAVEAEVKLVKTDEDELMELKMIRQKLEEDDGDFKGSSTVKDKEEERIESFPSDKLEDKKVTEEVVGTGKPVDVQSKGTSERNEKDSYELYTDSGVEEEPVHGVLKAAEIPEFVNVPTDSAPESPFHEVKKTDLKKGNDTEKSEEQQLFVSETDIKEEHKPIEEDMNIPLIERKLKSLEEKLKKTEESKKHVDSIQTYSEEVKTDADEELQKKETSPKEEISDVIKGLLQLDEKTEYISRHDQIEKELIQKDDKLLLHKEVSPKTTIPATFEDTEFEITSKFVQSATDEFDDKIESKDQEIEIKKHTTEETSYSESIKLDKSRGPALPEKEKLDQVFTSYEKTPFSKDESIKLQDKETDEKSRSPKLFNVDHTKTEGIYLPQSTSSPSEKEGLNDTATEKVSPESKSPVPSEKEESKLTTIERDSPKTASPVPSEKEELKDTATEKDSPKSKSPVPSEKEESKLTTVERDSPKTASPVPSEKEELKGTDTGKDSPKSKSPVPSEKEELKDTVTEKHSPESKSPVPSEKEESKLSTVERDSPKTASPVPSEKEELKGTDTGKDSPKSKSPVPSEKEELKGTLTEKDSPESKSPVPFEKEESKLTMVERDSPKTASPVPSEKEELIGTDTGKDSPKSLSPVPSEKEESKLLKVERDSPKSASPVPSEEDVSKVTASGKDSPKSVLSEMEESKILTIERDSPKATSPVPSEKDEITVAASEKDRLNFTGAVPPVKEGTKSSTVERDSPKTASPVPSEKDEPKLSVIEKESPKSVSPVPSEKEESKLSPEEKGSPNLVRKEISEEDITKFTATLKEDSPKISSSLPSETDESKLEAAVKGSYMFVSPTLSAKEECILSTVQSDSLVTASSVPSEKYEPELIDTEKDSSKSVSPTFTEKEAFLLTSDKGSIKSTSPVSSGKEELKPTAIENVSVMERKSSIPSEKNESIPTAVETLSTKSVSPVPFEKDDSKISEIVKDSSEFSTSVGLEKGKSNIIKEEDDFPTSPLPIEKHEMKQKEEGSDFEKSKISVLSETSKDIGKDLSTVSSVKDELKLASIEKESPERESLVPSEEDKPKFKHDEKETEKSERPVSFEKDEQKLEKCRDTVKSISSEPEKGEAVSGEEESASSVLSEKYELKHKDNEKNIGRSESPVTSEKDESKLTSVDKDITKSTSPILSERDESKLKENEKDISKSVSSVPFEKDEISLTSIRDDSVISASPELSEKYEPSLQEDVEHISKSPLQFEKDKASCQTIDKENVQSTSLEESKKDETKLEDVEKEIGKSVSPVLSENYESKPIIVEEVTFKKESLAPSEKEEKQLTAVDKDSPKSASPVPSEKYESDLENVHISSLSLTSTKTDQAKSSIDEKCSPKSVSPVLTEKHESKIVTMETDSRKSADLVPSEKNNLQDLEVDITKTTCSLAFEKDDQKQTGTEKASSRVTSPVPSEESKLSIEKDSPKSISPVMKELDDRKLSISEKDNVKSASPGSSEKDEWKQSRGKDSPHSESPEPIEFDDRKLSTSERDILKSPSPVPSEKDEYKPVDERESLKSISPEVKESDGQKLLLTEKDVEGICPVKLMKDESSLPIRKDSTKSLELKDSVDRELTSEKDLLTSTSSMLSQSKLSIEKDISPKSISPEPTDFDKRKLSTSDKDVAIDVNIVSTESRLSTEKDSPKSISPEPKDVEDGNVSILKEDVVKSASPVLPEAKLSTEKYSPQSTSPEPKDSDKRKLSTPDDYLTSESRIPSESKLPTEKDSSKSVKIEPTDFDDRKPSISDEDFGRISQSLNEITDENKEVPSKTYDLHSDTSSQPIPTESKTHELQTKIDQDSIPKSISPVPFEPEYLRVDKLGGYESPKSPSPVGSERRKMKQTVDDKDSTPKSISPAPSDDMNLAEKTSDLTSLTSEATDLNNLSKISTKELESLKEKSDSFDEKDLLEKSEKDYYTYKGVDNSLKSEKDCHSILQKEESIFTPGKTDVREILLDKKLSVTLSEKESFENIMSDVDSITSSSKVDEKPLAYDTSNISSKLDDKLLSEKEDLYVKSRQSSDSSSAQDTVTEEQLTVKESKVITETKKDVKEQYETSTIISSLEKVDVKDEVSIKGTSEVKTVQDEVKEDLDRFVTESTSTSTGPVRKEELESKDNVKESFVSSIKEDTIKTQTSQSPDLTEHKQQESILTNEKSLQESQSTTKGSEKKTELTKENESSTSDTTVRRMVVTATSEDGGLETELCSGSIQTGKDEKGLELLPTESKTKSETVGHTQIDKTISETSLSGEKGFEITSAGNITKTVFGDDHDADKTLTTTKTIYGDDSKTTVTTVTRVITGLPPLQQEKKEEMPTSCAITVLRKDTLEARSGTPGSDFTSERDYEQGPSTPHSDISSGQVSRAATNVWSRHGDSDEDVPCSPMSATSHVAHSPLQFDFDVHRTSEGYFEESPKLKETKIPSAMTGSLYGSLPQEDPLQGQGMESSMYSSMYVSKYDESDDDYDKGKFESMYKGEDVDFQTAVMQHKSTRGEELSKFTNGKSESGKSVNGDSKGFVEYQEGKVNGKSSSTKEVYTASTSSAPKFIPGQPFETGFLPKEEEKDPIEGWGKPLGLPPPPPPQRLDSPISPNSLDLIWNPEEEWGEPLGLPSPAPPPVKKDSLEGDNDLTPNSNKTTPKKVAKKNVENNKTASNITAGKEVSNKPKRSESPVKRYSNKDSRSKPVTPIYVDLTYVPHHGNSHYTSVEFFKRVRARYYVFSGTEPSREVFNALLEAKQTWEDKDLEVTIIPTYDTDTLGYWVAENEEILAKYKIDLSPSASRCTINLQDHDTSCSAYRLEF